MNLLAEPDSRLLEALHDVEDPEFPMSIVDMGLVVGVQRRGDIARVQVTFTSMGCPGMEMILEDIRERLLREPNVRQVHVEVVWEPIWTKARLSEDARQILRELGISI